MIKRNRIITIALCTLLAFPLAGCEEAGIFAEENAQMWENSGASSVAQVQEYDGEPYVVINDDEPDFTEDELQPEAYESYSELDGLGRCGGGRGCDRRRTDAHGEKGKYRSGETVRLADGEIR